MIKQPTIKILVGYHKPAILFKSDILTPIHLGRALTTQASKDGTMSGEDYQWMLDNMIGDDTGDNISRKNREFCEATALYWAWKNYNQLGDPDYIGFMHYRRLFVFDKDKDETISYFTNVKQYVKSLPSELYKSLLNSDLIVPRPENVNQYQHKNIYHHYEFYPIHYENGLAIVREIIEEKFSDLSIDYEKYMLQPNAYFTTMFIMSKNDFFSYCKILFEILFEFKNRIDISQSSLMNKRACAYICEYFTGAYLYHLEKTRKTRVVSRCFLTNTDNKQEYLPAFKKKNIPIVFSSDDKYAPYLQVSLYSLLKNASPKYNYDILIIDGKISLHHKKQLSNMSQRNVSIRYINIEPYLGAIDKSIFYLCSTHTISTYYRFFLPKILSAYNKVIYIDPDTIILKDISKLYLENIEKYWLAGVVDTGMICNINNKTDKSKETIINILGMDNPNEYLQAGLMLMNIDHLRRVNFTEKCIECLKRIKTPRFVDQDIINSVCYRRVKWLDFSWNVLWHLTFSIKLYERLLPEEIYLKYLASRNDPAIIHFAGPKPWNITNQEFSDVFWSYARDTACYEEILDRSWRSAAFWMTRPMAQSLENINKKINMETQTKKGFYKTVLILKLYFWKVMTFFSFGRMKKYSKQKKDKQKQKLHDLKGMRHA